MTRVFLCDDVADMRLLMRLSLEEEPAFDVVGEADCGLSALAAIPESKPHVVLLDLSMPGMGGLELIPRLRELLPETGIIVYSAFSTPRTEAQVLAAGADRYLKKGAPLERLREVVGEVARERSTASAQHPHPGPSEPKASAASAGAADPRTR
jgi:DNA-binding NarL/FixJ family response regulator